MIAFVLRETGARSGLADRRARAAARLERRLRGGLARRRGRRVRPHGVRAAGGDRRRHERRARPPHRVRVARPSSRRSSNAGSRALPQVVRDAPPYDGPLALPGEHNRRTRARRSRRSSSPASPRDEAAPALARFTGTGRRFEVHELAGGMTIVDDYGHHPTEIAATIAAVRERFPGRAAARALPAASLLADAASRGELAAALAGGRRRDGHGRLPGARGADRRASPASSSSMRSATAACSRRGRRPSSRAPRGSRGARGAGRRGARRRRRRRRPRRRPAAPLAWPAWRRTSRSRATRRSAPAGRRAGSRGPGTLDELAGASFAGREDRRGRRRGDRARLEPARRTTTASTRSCSSSPASWPRPQVDGDVLVAGGGATNAVCLHRARDAGLGGFEFASAIPGTAGGGVRMNAGAYGRDWRDVLIDAVVVDADGVRTLTPTSSGSRIATRRSRPGRGRRAGPVPARAASSSRGGQGSRRPSCSRQRKATQPTNKRTFGSVFKNPARGARRGAADRGVRPEGPPDRRRADLAAARELHRERRRRDVAPTASR